MEIDEGVVGLAKRRLQSRNLQLRGDQIALQMVAFGGVDGRIQFNQRLAGFAAALIPDALAAAKAQPDILYLPGIAAEVTYATRMAAPAIASARAGASKPRLLLTSAAARLICASA